MANLPQQGQPLPDLDLTAENGEHLGTAELKGQKTVLYFYPKDDTPGCTKEACAFRDRMDDYAEADIRVYGVSLDSPESHREFRAKYNLNFPLLTDEGGRASEALGVLRENRRSGEPRHLPARSRRQDLQGLPRGLARDPRRRDPQDAATL